MFCARVHSGQIKIRLWSDVKRKFSLRENMRPMEWYIEELSLFLPSASEVNVLVCVCVREVYGVLVQFINMYEHPFIDRVLTSAGILYRMYSGDIIYCENQY